LLQRVGVRTLADAFDLQAGDDLRKPGLELYRERIRLQVSDGNGSTKMLYLKRYRRPPTGPQLRRMFATGLFHSSAYHEKRFNRRLRQIGVPTARLLAFGQEMGGP
jgi:hypothetical protein